MSKDKNQEDKLLNKYRDSEGLTIREMNFGLWIAEHRKAMTRFMTIFLITISAFFFIYSTYGYIIYFMSGKLDNQLENQVMSPRNVVSNMAIAPVEKFSNGEKNDLAVRLQNPNDNFSAEFEYCFKQGEDELECGHSFILPSEDKHVLAIGVNFNNTPLKLSFVIKDIFWSRVNRRTIPDWPVYAAERLNFEITEVHFLNAGKSGLSENLKLNSLDFNIFNNTAFSYYEVPLDIFLYSGSRLVGLERHVAKEFISGEKRQIKISWPGELGAISRIEITPRININDESVYLKYRGLGQ